MFKADNLYLCSKGKSVTIYLQLSIQILFVFIMIMLVFINQRSDYCLLILQFHLVKHYGCNHKCVFHIVSSLSHFFFYVFGNFFIYLRYVVYYF
jgi:hypothetical protein